MSVTIKLEAEALDITDSLDTIEEDEEDDEMEKALQREDLQYSSQTRTRQSCSCPNCLSGLKKAHNCHYEGCDKTYTKTSHLKSHLLKHTGIRPHICTTCGKSFTRSDELRRHQRTHSGEKPHHCHRCGKSFMRSDHLKKHVRTHKDFDIEPSKKKRKPYVKKSEKDGVSCIQVTEPRTIKEEIKIESDDDDYDENFGDEEEHDFSNKKTGLLTFDNSRSETVWVSNGEIFEIKGVEEEEVSDS